MSTQTFKAHNCQYTLLKASFFTVTSDQTLFSFRFENYIPANKAKRKENLIQTFYETSATHFFDWWTFTEPANQIITSVACFSNMQIFHTWEKCGLADLKNCFYLLIFSQYFDLHSLVGKSKSTLLAVNNLQRDSTPRYTHISSVNKTNPEKIWTTIYIYISRYIYFSNYYNLNEYEFSEFPWYIL